MLRQLALGVLICLAAGCANYTVSRDALVQQLRNNQSRQQEFLPLAGITPGALPGLLTSLAVDSKYDSNGIEKILCVNSDGQEVYLYPDRNTQLAVKSKSSGVVSKMYFDTVFLVGDKISGFRSRLLHSMTNQTVVGVDDFESVQIYAEFPKTEPAK